MQMEQIVFGGGCFWCTEAVFLQLKGVISVIPGYAGGTTAHPTYELVSQDTSGYVEVVEVTYQPQEISLDDLLKVFFMSHDPSTRNRQGNDIGPQYRSVIFYTTNAQKEVAEHYIYALKNEHAATITTTVEPLNHFYPAEDYHKNYFAIHTTAPYCELIIAPKVEKVVKSVPSLIKNSQK